MPKPLYKWVRQKPEYESGDYWFNGKIFITVNVQEKLSQTEISQIVQDVRAYVQQNQGVDYLQVYKNTESDEKLFFIDQVSKESLDKSTQPSKHNYCTLMFDYEY